jgi:hypothetical protein
MYQNHEKLGGLRLYILMLGMLLSGTANTILMKVQNLTSGDPSHPISAQKFVHPFVQCAIMFIGELMCLGVYAAKTFYLKRQNNGMEVPLSPS